MDTSPLHASAMTTPNTYGHMWPDADESTRVAIAGVLAARAKVEEPEVLSTRLSTEKAR